jgi:SAM-dependent methyltransferase
MNAEVARKLIVLNDEFYQNFAASFGQTRNRIQPGVAKIVQDLQPDGNWLDIGCGNGSLAAEWLKQGGKAGVYRGLDASDRLIRLAQENISKIQPNPDLDVDFLHLSILSEAWVSHLPAVSWDGVFMFAVLHHIPGCENRIRLCREIASITNPAGLLYLSVWQLQHSARLMKRIRPWDVLDMEDSDLDTGDVLLDWKAQHPEDSPAQALRYVHIFSEHELVDLAGQSGFRIREFFYLDGREGNLGLYQIWQRDF